MGWQERISEVCIITGRGGQPVWSGWAGRRGLVS